MFPCEFFFGGVCGERSYHVFLLLFMVLWGPIFLREVLMLWHAFLHLGLGSLGIFLLAPSCLVALDAFSFLHISVLRHRCQIICEHQ
jgi:hypothetical protein